jgi:AmmeMemoRadiSam system protein B
VDLALLERLKGGLTMYPDRVRDNTVEVQLPLVAHFFPRARVVGMRAAPDAGSHELGVLLAEAADSLGRRLVVLGSTDLTHYGPNYGFSPAGTGEAAVSWARENDQRMIDALVGMDVDGAVTLAREQRSACSVGGALVAMGFARGRGVSKGVLLEYRTSRDVHVDSSFVGYAAIAYEA